jgi:hypothetical protein
MRALAVIVSVGLALSAAGDDAKPKALEWTKVSQAGKFEIEFPGKPTEMPAPTGTVYQLSTANPIALYQVAAAPLPDKFDPTDAKAVKGVFDNAVASTEKVLGGKVVSNKEIQVGDKHPARDVELEGTILGRIRARLVLTSNGFLQVVVAGSKEVVDGADAKRFHESLKVTGKE